MATNIPSWSERQKLLYRGRENKTDASILTDWGTKCIELGHLQDAFEYFKGAQNRAGLEKLRGISLEEGDAFLMAAVENALGEAGSTDQWNKLGYRAFELGKYRFAKTAFEKSQNEIMLAKIRATLGETTPEEGLTPDVTHEHPHGT